MRFRRGASGRASDLSCGINCVQNAQRYNPGMARGWERKSVEAQIEESTSEPVKPHALSAGEVQLQRKRTDLMLSRQRVLQQMQLSSSERYSEILRQTLRDLDVQIAGLRRDGSNSVNQWGGSRSSSKARQASPGTVTADTPSRVRPCLSFR